MSPVWPASGLWDDAVELYARPGVTQACLALQDRHGADVNLLLFACWLGRSGRAADPALLRAALALGTAWQADMVALLRRVRRELKLRLDTLPLSLRDPLASVRQGLAAVELQLERGELQQLELLAGPPGSPDPGRSITALAVLAPASARTAPELLTLLAAAFPGLPAAHLEALWAERLSR